ncbi:hypothetical protein FB567DRAFT_553734 [Paraphoma chrysanthemicola]|uniref:RRM domain-containing protein n=1 Tax=Paraphoma chrysanthemicola TaxID=798071 RepID=A0A8K0QY43_9PLEO|nr:hypothetical protein FB567DRAFT_553734 [Paraphoma chrysanthemicola]
MRRAREHKGKDEHLIFVKNVPTYMANRAVPDLYAPYQPIRIKNVYPNSDITTVVLGFQTEREASQAQADTDGYRLENVVLRVESYSKHRSIRHIRGERNASQPMSAVNDDDEVEENERPESRPDSEYEVVFPLLVEQAQQDTTGATTWAQIAKQTRLSEARPAQVEPRNTTRLRRAKAPEKVKEPTSVEPIATPLQTSNVNDDSTAFRKGEDDALHADSPVASSEDLNGYEGDVEYNKKMKTATAVRKEAQVTRSSIFSPWEPINTSQRIHQRHCRGCIFCQLRARN